MGVSSKGAIAGVLFLVLLLALQANSRPLASRTSPVDGSVRAPPSTRPRAVSPPSARVVTVTGKDRIVAGSGKLFFAMLPRVPVPPSGPSPGTNGNHD